MGISVKYCFDNPEWAAKRIDELEAQLVSKFFAPIGEAKMRTLTATTPLEIERALTFVDALDYAHGYTRWVDTMKVLAFALRARVPEEGASKRLEALQRFSHSGEHFYMTKTGMWVKYDDVAAFMNHGEVKR